MLIVAFGSFFAPIIAVLAVVRLLVCFYIKRYITMRFCHPSEVGIYRHNKLAVAVWGWMMVFLAVGILPILYIMLYKVRAVFAPSAPLLNGTRPRAKANAFTRLFYDHSQVPSGAFGPNTSRWVNSTSFIDPFGPLDTLAMTWNRPDTTAALFTNGTCSLDIPAATCQNCLLSSRDVQATVCWTAPDGVGCEFTSRTRITWCACG